MANVLRFSNYHITKLIHKNPQAITGAAPQSVVGSPINLQAADNASTVETGSLCARVYLKSTTNNLAIYAYWEASMDGANYYKVLPANGAALVPIVTGTGSAVEDTVWVPLLCSAVNYARFVVTSKGAVGAGLGADECQIYAYQFRKAG